MPQEEARQRYVEIGEVVALEQIRKDSETLDLHSIAVGPFARLDANEVAARDGKTRGVISNLFGSQAAFQAATMALALNSRDWIAQIQYPDPGDYEEVDAWLDAFFTGESERGPLQGGQPIANYGSVWALWLSAVPYGMWSEKIRRPSMEEHTQWLEKLERVLEEALHRFGILTSRRGDGERPRLCVCQPDRRRLAEPMYDDPPPVRPLRTNRYLAASFRETALVRRDRGNRRTELS